MNKIILRTYLCALSLVCLPLTAQNMASIEAPSGIAFVYGFDYHPAWYTQLKPTVGFGWANSSLIGKSKDVHYSFIIEQRYYYNIIKREAGGKNTLHKSADYFSIKPAYRLTREKHDYKIVDGQIAKRGWSNVHMYYCTANWGMRRALGKRFYFDGSVGLGPSYSSDFDEWGVLCDLNLSIGFKLF
jgi:hypothetical protein